MTTLAAIGLASNVLQFIQLGTKLAMEARELYKSASGSTASNARLEADTELLKALITHMKTPVPSAASATKAEQQLLDCAKSCDEVADELLSLLQASKVKRAKSSRLQALRRAMYNEFTHDQATQLHKRLQELQAGTVLRLLAVLRYCLLLR